MNAYASELLQDLGLEVKLANPSKVRIIAASQIKPDKVDAFSPTFTDQLSAGVLLGP